MRSSIATSPRAASASPAPTPETPGNSASPTMAPASRRAIMSAFSSCFRCSRRAIRRRVPAWGWRWSRRSSSSMVERYGWSRGLAKAAPFSSPCRKPAPQHPRRSCLMKNPAKPILLVEDDQIDIMTVIRALKELHVTNRVEYVENGEAALDYLRDPAKDRPCLILLDLNMPVMGGIEFLRVVKGNDHPAKRIPVVVLTTSEEQQDKVESFNLGVAGYIRKPVDYRRFVETMRTIDAYWTVSELPE